MSRYSGAIAHSPVFSPTVLETAAFAVRPETVWFQSRPLAVRRSVLICGVDLFRATGPCGDHGGGDISDLRRVTGLQGLSMAIGARTGSPVCRNTSRPSGRTSAGNAREGLFGFPLLCVFVLSVCFKVVSNNTLFSLIECFCCLCLHALCVHNTDVQVVVSTWSQFGILKDSMHHIKPVRLWASINSTNVQTCSCCV